MMGLTFILFAIALVDSTSMIPIGLFPLAAILGGRHPVIGGLSFISGIFLVQPGGNSPSDLKEAFLLIN